VWRLPFISIASHEETIRAKDETISVLRETVTNLTASLKSFESVAEALKAKPKAPLSSLLDRPEKAPKPQKINYANLDPDDNQALAAAALAEVGGGRHNIERIRQRMELIRQRIIEARARRTATDVVAPATPPPPDAVTQLINEAVEQGEAAARVN